MEFVARVKWWKGGFYCQGGRRIRVEVAARMDGEHILIMLQRQKAITDGDCCKDER